MALVGWLDTADVTAEWYDAPADPELGKLLGAAFEVCSAFAPAIPPAAGGGPGPVPERYRMAQMLQAKHLFARSKAGNADGYGPDGLAISTFPLVMEARSLLRPRRGNVFKGVL